MNVFNMACFLAGAACITGGLVFDAVQLIGVFRYKYVMNRIHAAAIGDTLGVGLILLGVLFINGFNLAGLKVLSILAFLWLTAPVAAHMVGKLEVRSKERPEDCCPVKGLSVEGSQPGGASPGGSQEKEPPMEGSRTGTAGKEVRV